MIVLASLGSAILNVHKNLAVSVLLYTGIVAVWGIGLYLTGRGPTGSYLGALVLNEILIVAQSLAGLMVYSQGYRPPDNLHFLYGIVSVLVLPGLYYSPYTQRGTARRDALYLGFGGLFLVGIAIRAMTTGSS